MWLLFPACAPTAPTAPPADPDPSTLADATADTGAPPAVDPLVVLSLNLHCLKLEGTPYSSNAERFAAIAAEVAASGVDAIAAQEVCVGAEDARDLLADALLAATGESWHVAWAFAHVGWEGTPDQADEGVAVFARGALAEVREIVYVSPGELRRVALVARLAEGPVLASVHLDWGDAAAREDQARQTGTWTLPSGLDAIVAGDLNDRAGSPTHDAFLALGFEDAAAGLDPDRIDHVLVHRGAAWGAAGARTVLTDPPVSDHPGVLVELLPRPAPEVVLTRFVAEVDVGFGHTVSIRGDTPPLSWERGWWAYPAAADRWELVLTELAAPFAFKALRDEVTWEVGPDRTGAPGDEIAFAPTF